MTNKNDSCMDDCYFKEDAAVVATNEQTVDRCIKICI